MNDTQWPRYEVFKQDNVKKRHEAVGSVHAADAEMALLSARNLFVRRPSAVSLWIVPANAIFAMTREEMEAKPDWWLEHEAAGVERPFHIFTKTNQRRSMTFVQHVGQINAQSNKDALNKAIESEQFNNDKVWVWWVMADAAIIRSEDDDIESMFAPAQDKTYRQQSHYGFVNPGHKKRGRKRQTEEPTP